MTDEQAHIARAAAALDGPKLCRDIEDMTDAQDESPERIWLEPGVTRPTGSYPPRLTWPDHPKAVEYVRSDLARPSQAGDERVARLVAVGRRQVESMCEGFCKNLPSSEFFTEDMEHDCAVCRLRAALAAMDTPKGGDDTPSRTHYASGNGSAVRPR